MAKTINFVDTASRKVITFEKDYVRAKRGNLIIERILGENEHKFRVTHFGTVILELDFSNPTYEVHTAIKRWHIQSITDANYIGTIMDAFGYSQKFRTGYRPVNGGGYFETLIGDEWVTVGGEE